LRGDDLVVAAILPLELAVVLGLGAARFVVVEVFFAALMVFLAGVFLVAAGFLLVVAFLAVFTAVFLVAGFFTGAFVTGLFSLLSDLELSLTLPDMPLGRTNRPVCSPLAIALLICWAITGVIMTL